MGQIFLIKQKKGEIKRLMKGIKSFCKTFMIISGMIMI